jgi:hypothetical protein
LKPGWRNRLRYHGTLSDTALSQLARQCDIGLNCQRNSDPASGLTFPSKIFSYFSSGLAVISSTASDVPKICGPACRYYEGDMPKALALVMSEAIHDYTRFTSKLDIQYAIKRYSLDSTTDRLRELFAKL